jgi:hypothetical protein
MNEDVKKIYRYEDGNLYRLHCSGGQKVNSVAGWETVCNGKKYKKINIKNKTYYLHQIIFLYHYGFIPKYIDHADGDSLNNKIENLREATQSQNVHNSKLRRTNKSGYKGVAFYKNKWKAAIMVMGKNISLGSYEKIEDAVLAYKQGCEKFYGHFAKP